MKYKLSILLSLLLLISCKVKTQEKTKFVVEKETVTEKELVEIKETLSEQTLSDCDKYWMNRFPSDTLKIKYISKIIAENKNTLTKNNLVFLNALKSQKQNDLAFNKVLSPIFRLSNSEIGILTFPKYKQVGNAFISVSKEMDLIQKFDTLTENTKGYFGKIRFYPMLLNSVFKQKSKPIINYYTVNKIDSTQISELGAYLDECLEYYEYSIDTTNISINDKLLFCSPYKIDLTFESSINVDSLLKNQVKKECLDCPNSSHLEKTFAKLNGTENVYFIYADTFPLNNKLDTPSRGLILLKGNNEIVYLWYDEIDLFGCSCL